MPVRIEDFRPDRRPPQAPQQNGHPAVELRGPWGGRENHDRCRHCIECNHEQLDVPQSLLV